MGLIYLNFAPSEGWAEQRTTFRSSPILTIFWTLALLFVQVAPFIENGFLVHVKYYVFPTLGTSLLAIGTIYWLIWAKLLPALGYHIQHEIVQMPDGSERVKYKVRLVPRLSNRSCVLLTLIFAEGQAKETEKEAGTMESSTEAICLVNVVFFGFFLFIIWYSYGMAFWRGYAPKRKERISNSTPKPTNLGGTRAFQVQALGEVHKCEVRS